jgi:hypothetical protein
MKRAAIMYIAALAAIAVWLVFAPDDPPRNCSYSPILKSCTWN